jgi:hypothetical protein
MKSWRVPIGDTLALSLADKQSPYLPPGCPQWGHPDPASPMPIETKKTDI